MERKNWTPTLLNLVGGAASSLKSKMSISLVICLALGASPFLPANLWTDTGYHNKQRILEALCLTSLPFFFLCNFLRKEQSNIRVGVGIARYSSIFFLIGFISCLNAFSPRYALYEWSSFLLLGILVWAIAHEIMQGQARLMQVLLWVSGFGCAYYLLHVILIYVSVMSASVQPKPDDFIVGFDNYRFFNHAQTISLPFLVILTVRSERFGRQYWFWLIVASVWWSVLFVSAGRGTFVGLTAGALITWFFRRGLAGDWLRIMVITGLSGLIIYLLFFTLVPVSLGLKPFGFSSQVVQRTMVDPASGRELLWQLAWQIICEHPWLGGGPLHFAHSGPVVDIAAHPHNWVLQIASEWGVPALIFLIAAIGLAYKALVRTGRAISPSDTVNQAMLCAWLTIGAAILVDGLVSGLIVMPVSQLWIALYIGCAWGWCSFISPASYMSARPARRNINVAIVVAVIFVAVLALFWRGLYPEITELSAHEVNALQSDQYSHKQLRPRIWAAGYF